MREEVSSEDAPSFEGFPFSQAIRHGDTLYLSGQAALDPDTGEIVGGGIAEQTRRTMENVGLVLEAADAGFGDVVKATVFLRDMGEFGTFNEAYLEFFEEPYPARSAVEVSDLAAPFDVEIEVVAAVE